MSDTDLSSLGTAPLDVATPAPHAAGLTSRVVRGSLWVLGGQGVAMLAALLATPFVIRLLGAEQYGVLALSNVLFNYLAFADMGMGVASTRFGADAHARKDDRSEILAIWTSLVIACVPALLIALGLMFGAHVLVVRMLRLPSHLHGVAIIAVRLIAIGFFARAIAGVLNTPQLVRLRMDLVTFITTGTSVTQILSIPIVVLLGSGLVGAVAVIAGSSILAAILHASVSARLLPGMLRPVVSRELFKPILKFGAAMVTSSLAAVLLAHGEKLLLTRYASVTALAHYTVAYTLALMVTLAPGAMGQSLLPAFSQIQAQPERNALRQLHRRALCGTLLWIVPISVLLGVAARPFFTLWAGPEFGRESTMPFYILAIGLIFNALSHVPYILLIALDRTKVIARIHLAELVPYLLAAGLLTYRFGAVGAACAWTLRVTVDALAFFLAARRITGFSSSPLPDNKRGYVVALIVLLVPVMFVSWHWDAAFIRLAVALVAIIAYSALILSRVITSEERASMLRLLPFGRWRNRLA
ncbi:MAG: flippase [Pyrinomonadaceae bacterium]